MIGAFGIYRRSLFIVLVSLFTQSCATTTEETQPADEAIDTTGSVEEQFIATEGLEPRERFSKALRLLENGEVGQANAELQSYVLGTTQSRSKNARSLLEQINKPIEDYFPAEHFSVSLGDGESLSTLAKTYLGDALKFYALARYNSIGAPSRVFVGQEVRIPLTDLARLARDKATVETEIIKSTISTDSSGEEKQTMPVQEVLPVEKPLSIAELIAAGQFSKAVEYANSAAENNLDNDTLIVIYKGYAEQSITSNPYIAADAYHRLSELYQQEDDMEAALAALESALSANPDHSLAADSLDNLKPRLVANYYRSASAAFRRQDLDTTIKYADKVLALDPEHANALLYRAQAVELKERLEKLNAKN